MAGVESKEQYPQQKEWDRLGIIRAVSSSDGTEMIFWRDSKRSDVKTPDGNWHRGWSTGNFVVETHSEQEKLLNNVGKIDVSVPDPEEF
ncbi:hypothetical protein JXA63_01130 [Candidatus Woesebacteria bacterium]|nr:hypothetical protein [Candidatus Woesebacteria bacterium]